MVFLLFSCCYMPAPPSSSNMSLSRDVSTSNTYQVHIGNPEQGDFYVHEQHERERARWANFNGGHAASQQQAPSWLNRGMHDLKDSEDDVQSMQSSSTYLRGQNAPWMPILWPSGWTSGARQPSITMPSRSSSTSGN